ncbi:MAG: hypothetical protein WCR31_07775, partial [Treponema sp.]
YTLQVNTSVVPSRLKLIFDTAVYGTVYKTGEIAVDELYLDGLTPHFLLGNITKASYKKEGTIIQTGSFPLLENLSLSSTAAESASFGTKTPANNAQTATASSAASVTAATIALSGDAAFSSAESGGITNAGYSTATTRPMLGIFSFSGAYRFDHSGSSLEHADKAALNFSRIYIPLTLSAYAASTGSLWSLNQKSGAAAELSFSGADWGTTLSGTAEVVQKILPSASGAPSFNTDSFAGGWTDSAALAYSTGNSAASLRTNDNIIRLSTTIPFISLEPQFIFETAGKYTSSASVLYTDTTSFTTRIPFKISSQSFSLEWVKKGGGTTICRPGGDYISDYTALFNSFNLRSWYFYSWAFNDMMSTALSQAVLDDTSMTTTSSDSLFYSTCYSASWTRPLSASVSDFYIPSSASFAVARDIRTSEKISDTYQLKTTVVTNAFNIFGRESILKLFRWYNQDEYNTSLTGAVKIPKADSSDVTFQMSAYTQENFYINDSDILKTGLEVNFETDGDWSTEGTVVWKRRGKSSPLTELIKQFRQSYDPSAANISRTSSVDITFSSTDSVLKQVYILVNTLDAKLNKYFSFSCGTTGSYTCTEDTSILLSLTLQLGGKVQF